jgi:phosphoribosylanthranilate isomerase
MKGQHFRERLAARDGRFVKVCCIQDISEALAALSAGADALGFVASMPSGPGPISDTQIASILKQLPAETCSFLLTSRETPNDILQHLEECPAAVVQVVRDIGQDGLAALRESRPDVTWVQVVHVDSVEAIERALKIDEIADAILLDSGRPNAAQPTLGGTGETHDWEISKTITQSVSLPVLLAGGLRPNNIALARHGVRPAGFDLCSGIRVEGRLDAVRMRDFFEALEKD